MNINLTLIVQMIFFAVFVALCMKYVWPPLIAALKERERKIDEGLREAERAQKTLELAQQKSEQTIREAKQEAAQLIEQANKRAVQIIEESKESARAEGEKIVSSAHLEVDRHVAEARETLRGQVGVLVGEGVHRILGRVVDQSAHNDIVEELSARL